MTQSSSPWDGISVGDASVSPYSATEWAHLWNLLHGVGSIFPNYGIIPGTGDGTYDPLQVRQTTVASVNVEVHIGAALVNGKLYESSAAELLAVGANASGNPRIDTAILRVDYTAQTTRLVIKQGTPAGSPVAPTLTQSASVWEIPLANIAVANGFSTITAVNITDRRRAVGVTGAGWQPFVYSLGHIPNGAYNAGGVAVRGLAVPISITGNMLVKQITFVPAETTSRPIQWGIFTEDLNDGIAANAVLRFIGGDLVSSSVSIVSGTPKVLPANPSPFYLAPGSYWVLLDGIEAITSLAAGTFDANTNKALVNTAGYVIGQTVDMDSGWAASTLSYAIRVDGQILGEVTGF